MSNYSNYRKFLSKEEVESFAAFLTEKNIHYKIVETAPVVDITFAGNQKPEIWLQLLQSDFSKVDKIFEEEFSIDSIDPEHYFYDFTDDELIDVLQNYDEWNKSDFLLAKKLLVQRGIDVSDAELIKLKNDKLAELETPEVAKPGWIAAGYVFSIASGLIGLKVGFASTGGFVGIIIGFAIAKSKQTLPDGRKVWSFDRKSRFHGKYIVIIGAIVLISGLIINALSY